MLQNEMWPTADRVAKIFPELVIMDSHLKPYEKYCQFEERCFTDQRHKISINIELKPHIYNIIFQIPHKNQD